MAEASFNRYESSDLLEMSIQTWLDIKFVQNGMYSNIAESGGWYGGSERLDQLTRVNANVYESNFNNWIYETDTTGPSGYEIILSSGIEVDNVFTAWGSGALAPSVDYKNGRVLLQSDPGVSAVVSSAFSYKKVDVQSPDSAIVKSVYSKFKNNSEFGLGNAPSGMSRQLPLVVVDPQNRDLTGRQLGGGSIVNQQVVFHVVANSRREANKIIDTLTTKSFRKTIQGVDFNDVPSMFDRYGGKLGAYQNFTTLQSNNSYKWEKIYIDEVTVVDSPVENLGIYTARVDWDVVFHMPAGG